MSQNNTNYSGYGFMKSGIKNHISLLNHADIAQICAPLQRLNITYFGHAKISKEGEFAAITNGPEFFHHYLNHEYYNWDIHAAQSDLISNYCIWDAIELCAESAKMDQEANAFGVWHTFTITNKNADENNYYHFATHYQDKSINQVYLENIDLLHLFIMHFNEKITSSKILSQAYDIKFSIDHEKKQFHTGNIRHDFNQKLMRESFLNEISLDKTILRHTGTSLTMREIDILACMHYGKTANDIAKLLGVAEVSVNKRIASIKNKFQCYTQFQLGEHLSNLFPQSRDILEKLMAIILQKY